MGFSSSKSLLFAVSIIILIIQGLLASAAAVSNPNSTESLLLKNVLSAYDPAVRPVRDASKPLMLTTTLGFYSILNVDTDNSLVGINLYVEESWTDEFVSWQPSQYAGLRKFVFRDDSAIWLPDTTIYNSGSTDNAHQSFSTVVFAKYDGTIYRRRTGVVQAVCALDVRAFPSDTQDCYVEIGSRSMSALQLDVNTPAADAVIKIDSFQASSEWTLLSTSVERKVHTLTTAGETEQYPTLVFRYKIHRNSKSYLLQLYLPSVALVATSIGALFVPMAYGERLGFSMSVTLALIGLYFINKGTIPSSALVTRTDIFNFGNFLFSIASVFETIIAQYLSRKVRVPSCVKGEIARWRRRNQLLKGLMSQNQSLSMSTTVEQLGVASGDSVVSIPSSMYPSQISAGSAAGNLAMLPNSATPIMERNSAPLFNHLSPKAAQYAVPPPSSRPQSPNVQFDESDSSLVDVEQSASAVTVITTPTATTATTTAGSSFNVPLQRNNVNLVAGEALKSATVTAKILDKATKNDFQALYDYVSVAVFGIAYIIFIVVVFCAF